MADLSDDELLDALGVEAAPAASGRHTPREERLMAGFEDILRFVETHGRVPQHGEGRDIFERLYAVRLQCLRALPEAQALLAARDVHGLLSADEATAPPAEALDDEALLAELGVAAPTEDDITVLKHVRSQEDRRVAEEIADRNPCPDFARFKPLFAGVESDLKAGLRQTLPFGKEGAAILEGDFFILGGQLVYVAEVGETIKTSTGKNDARLRVVYANGTESNLLLRSLQRALYKDEGGRRITPAPDAGPVFGGIWEDDDIETGTIYVLRSLSAHPFIAQHRELVHKIGVTGGAVETRIAHAAHDATYLLADVEVVASYKLSGINRTKLEHLFHRIFAAAQLDLTIDDRFGTPVRPREWFLVPLPVIDEVVQRIRDGSITKVLYDPKSARLVALADG
ncbi:GIY-YIG nuclease family protein [Acidiferrobacter thiooxydans]|uniref:GIY-YIG nuclease family protein n=1 Tax=Acidiferrobacter thiooxydans TaxID=163359 RepID=UPI000826699D|nr:GIY-YIG nuclease family protein [Acidiferrobacter thiooxydans]UEO00423.1 GIY-YIG nuclease family protein [Acidiferrobacter thiooxydans]